MKGWLPIEEDHITIHHMSLQDIPCLQFFSYLLLVTISIRESNTETYFCTVEMAYKYCVHGAK